MSMAESTSDVHYHRVEKSSDEGCSNWRLLRRAVHQASVSDAARDALLRKSDRPWTPELVRRSKGEPPPLLRAMTANFVLRRTTYERAVAESGLTCQGLLVSVGPLQALTARALAIGLVCGVVSAAYKAVMDACLHFVWPTLGPLVMSALGLSPPFYILIAGTLLSTANGVALRVLGEPTNNLPEVVVQIHSDGQLDSSPREFLSMTIVSLFTICSGASFGPEAPLIAIGGGLASLAAERFALPKAEVLVLTLCGMGAGLAAFFGQPIGGALFACEVIHSHGLEYFEALIPAVSAAVACNFAFRVVSHLPGGGAVWAFPAEPALAASTALLGAPLGLIGGALGVGWMAAVTRLRGGLTTRGVMKHHVAKGAVAGLVIGTIGICLPETLFWAEAEAQTLIDGGQTQLEHAWPSAGVFGRNDYLTRPAVLVAICLGKLLAIGASVLGGHRGGFIFPFFFAGISLGLALAKWASHVAYVSPAACALCVAASLNVAVTKSWLSTPVVLCEVSGRVDVLPCLLVASVVALFVADGKAVIKAARPRSDNDAEHQLG